MSGKPIVYNTAQYPYQSLYTGGDADGAFANTYSMIFDGVDEYCSISGKVGGYGADTEFSCSFWFKQGDHSDGMIVGTGYNNGWHVRNLTTTGKLRFIFTAGSAYLFRDSNTQLTIGQWYRCTATYDGGGSAANMHIYIDGSNDDAGTGSNGTPTNVGSNTYIGGDGNSHFFGNIDEVVFWDSELSAAEASEDYNSGVAMNPTTHSTANASNWWRMGDGSGDSISTIEDQIGTDDATPTNMEAGDIEEDVP